MPRDDASRPVPAPPTAAVVLAAGEGRRMRSAVPKVLHAVGGATLLGHAVAAVAALAPEHLAVVVGHGREQVCGELDALADRFGRPVTSAVQAEQLGTGHAVRCGLEALPSGLTGAVLVTYGDVPLLAPATLAGLVAEHEAAGAAVTLVTGEPADPTGYGRIVRGPDGAVLGIVEHRDATPEQRAIREVNSGIYAFDAEFLAASLDGLERHNAQGELYLTDLVAAAVAAGRVVQAVPCRDAWQTQGVNDRVQLAEIRAELNRRVLHRWMLEGVTVVDPATTWVDVDVVLGRDVVLHPGVQLHGATRVDDGAEVGPDTTLADCLVGEGATVVRTHGSASEIGPGASVGPFAYLRPGARLGERGKIGTFVEVKNSEIGRGAKVPHLSYIGDAEIGSGTNIGAGAITANFPHQPGLPKGRTTIGDGVRTGVHNSFMAPVTIGDGAWVAAHSIVTDDVPPGAMAIARARQVTKEGYVDRQRNG